MRHNRKTASLIFGIGAAALLFAGASLADSEGKSRKSATAPAASVAAQAAPLPALAPAAPLPAPAPVIPAPAQPSVIYNFYFGLPATAGATVPAGSPVPVTAPAAVASAPVALPAAPAAPAAPARTQYEIYCASCHGNSMKNSSVSKIQSGSNGSSSMRAAVGNLSTAILSAIAAGQ